MPKMTSKWPETRRGEEIFQFNRGFLDLLRSASDGPEVFGLDRAIRTRLASMTGNQLDLIAHTPCLLAGFSPLLSAGASGVSDAGPPSPVPVRGAQIYAASLLAWLWQAIRQDKLLGTLCMGPDPAARDQLAAAGLRDLQCTAAEAGRHLEARFCRHPRFWPDLVRAAAAGDARLLAATRVSAVQLTLVARVPLAPDQFPVPRGGGRPR